MWGFLLYYLVGLPITCIFFYKMSRLDLNKKEKDEDVILTLGGLLGVLGCSLLWPLVILIATVFVVEMNSGKRLLILRTKKKDKL